MDSAQPFGFGVLSKREQAILKQLSEESTTIEKLADVYRMAPGLFKEQYLDPIREKLQVETIEEAIAFFQEHEV